MGKEWLLIAAVTVGCASTTPPVARARNPHGRPGKTLAVNHGPSTAALAGPVTLPVEPSSDDIATLQCAKGGGCSLHIDLRSEWEPGSVKAATHARVDETFITTGLLLVVKNQAGQLASTADELVVSEEREIVEVARSIHQRLNSNDPTPVVEREFRARVEFDLAVEALRARVDERICACSVNRLLETPEVIAALRSASAKLELAGYAYESELVHGKRFLASRCGEFVDVDAAIQRRRGRWVATMKGKL